MKKMNTFDLIVLIILSIAFVAGFRKGMIMQLVSLVGLMIALVFAGYVAKNILPLIIENVHDISPNVASALSYIFAFIVIMAAAHFLGRAIEKLIEIVHLSFFNKTLGGVISIGISMTFLSLLLNLVLMLDTNEKIIRPDTKTNSFFFERVRVVVPAIVPYLNQEVWMQYVPDTYRKQLKKSVPKGKSDVLDSTDTTITT